MTKINLAIFASGGGSNARKIVEHFEKKKDIRIKLIASNRKNAGVLALCQEYGISKLIFGKEFFQNSDAILEVLKVEKIDYIILAGFLWKIPTYLIDNYPDRILNIHPALLPKFGGAGMYGNNVHKAVVEARETESGPTMHLVNEKYDDGRVLFQASISLSPSDTPEQVALKVLTLEHLHYSKVIESYCTSKR